MTRHLQVRLENEVYERLEAAAKERGASLNTVGRDAIMDWLEGSAGKGQAFGVMSKQEEMILRGVLAYIRDKPYPPEREAWVNALAMLAKRYGK